MIPMDRHAPARTQVPPLDHALKRARLQADQGLRVANASLGALRLLAEDGGAATWNELWTIGDAALKRLFELQSGWAHDWMEWLRYASQVEGASSLSKLTAREYNIVIQAAQLVSEQSVALFNLAENIEVNVLHLISERSPPPPPA